MVSEDHYMYAKKTTDGIMFLILYIDDILLVGNKLEIIKATKKWLSYICEMKDVSKARLSQEWKYSEIVPRSIYKKVLEWFQIYNSKPVDNPVEQGLTLSLKQYPKTDGEIKTMNNVPYTSVTGNLMQAMLCTRPNTCFMVGLVSRYQLNAEFAEW